MNAEFVDSIKDTLKMIPMKYRIDLTVRFSDPDGWNEQMLTDILRKNLRLQVGKASREVRRKDLIAVLLIVIGAVFFALRMLVHGVWGRDSFLNDLLYYVADLATTVTMYEALTILLLQQGEFRIDLRNIERRISSVRFELGDGDQVKEN
ncbi:MAG: hypothetical protein J6U30_05775 [Oscillospiraceae bacterium]|nr:hypothetical protein [Oscillospiraceae bacterium]